MELKKTAIVGTLESSDVQITLQPNPKNGIEIELQSIVKAMFGNAIKKTVISVLNEFQINDAYVQINDKGALDHVIRSRMQAAVCFSAEIKYEWERVD
jgi:citrate lyase subunit gamma (acyl carrier protein)